MKKLIVMLIATALLMGLCACGEEAPAEENVQIDAKPKVEATTVIEETVELATAATEEDPAVLAEKRAQENKALAESCIDKDVLYLYELIGKPNSADYAPSCLVDGEDGMLYYDGFVVYTTREGDVETVYYVE